MSQQLVFDLLTSYPPSLENFVPGRNDEALSQLCLIAQGRSNTAITYLWGASSSGKTHLIQGVRDAARRAGLTVFEHDSASLARLDSEIALKGSSVLHLIDDVQKLDRDGCDGLFALINLGRLSPSLAILASGDSAPATLALKAELRSRLAWGLVFQLHPLADADKAMALQRLAAERGVHISADLVPYMLSHTARDMRALTGLFDTLDRYALARNRALTLPLLREYLQLNLSGPP